MLGTPVQTKWNFNIQWYQIIISTTKLRNKEIKRYMAKARLKFSRGNTKFWSPRIYSEIWIQPLNPLCTWNEHHEDEVKVFHQSEQQPHFLHSWLYRLSVWIVKCYEHNLEKQILGLPHSGTWYPNTHWKQNLSPLKRWGWVIDKDIVNIFCM